MSMNIHFEATRQIKVIKTDKIEDQTIFFDAVQTPTDVTYQIINSKDPFQAYRDYVLELCQDYEAEIFDPDDFWCDNPIGKEIRNDGPELVQRFDDWLKSAEEAGYTVSAIVL